MRSGADDNDDGHPSHYHLSICCHDTDLQHHNHPSSAAIVGKSLILMFIFMAILFQLRFVSSIGWDRWTYRQTAAIFIQCDTLRDIRDDQQ